MAKSASDTNGKLGGDGNNKTAKNETSGHAATQIPHINNAGKIYDVSKCSKVSKRAKRNKNVWYTLWGTTVAVAIAIASIAAYRSRSFLLSRLSYIFDHTKVINANLEEPEEITEHFGWAVDEEYELLADNIRCDFPIIDLTKSPMKTETIKKMLNQPFVIRGLMRNWPAVDRWKKTNLTRIYGDRVLRMGSESSIVYAGGAAGQQSKLGDIIANLGKSSNDSDIVDSFTFDVSVLRSIPEMGRDFKIPPIFSDWDNGNTIKSGTTWHILSLGASRTGKIQMCFRSILVELFIIFVKLRNCHQKLHRTLNLRFLQQI
jgi:hypothetical protein